MNAPSFFAGVAMMIVGALLLFACPQLIMVPSTQTQVVGLYHDEAFVVGDLWERSVQLDEGVLVNGTVWVSSALTGELSQVSVLVVDDVNYQKWVAHGSPTYVLQKDISNGEAFLFTVPRTGLYHFIFDNTSSPVKKNVKMTASLQRQVTVNVPDERVRYVACSLLGIGAVVTVVGAFRKTQIPWA
jgi:tetrahydromethanopterin S-methyltransferase subunit C